VPRWWWIAGACAVVAFAVYVSLVPFRFVQPPFEPTAATVWRIMLDNRGMSRSNLLANGVMMLPFGFFGAASLIGERARWWRWLIASAFIVATSLGISTAIETLQVYVPSRTPSLADIEAQTVGTVFGVIAWFVLGREVSALSATFASGSRRALEVVLVGYAAVRMLLLLQPLDVSVELPELARKFRAGRVVINPMRSPSLHWEFLPSVLSDVLLGVPIGVLASIVATRPGTRRPALSAMLLGGFFFLLGELGQLFVRSRTADVVDFTANTLGVVVGVALVSVLTTRRVAGQPSARATQTWMTAGLALAALVYILYNLAPFNFTFSRAQVASRAGMLLRFPFAAYYLNPEFKALADASIKMAISIPFGILFQLGWHPNQRRFGRLLELGWLMLTTLFFATVEVGQVFLPSRFPDDTDILLAAFAVWLGIRLARPFDTAPSARKTLSRGLI
jgi:glycopeptide antibiotics resistance protein